ncbi:MAG: PAS domain-containing protein [Bacteroidales bacterium]
MSKKEDNLTERQLLRIKAEEQLKSNRKKFTSDSRESDAKKLLHELQVHQIELEMQNEELRQANATAEEALRRYTMLYDFAPMGYFILDGDGSIADLNFTGAEILGEKRFSLINSNFKVFLSEKSKPVFNSFFKKVFSGNSRESCELVLSCNDKPLCRVYAEGVVTGDDRQCLLSLIDISGFQK